MKIWSLFAMLALLCAGCATPPPHVAPKQVVFAASGRSDYEIVLPDRYDNPGVGRYLAEAAEYLADGLRESSGARLDVVRESKRTPGKKAIFIGGTKTARKQGFTGFQDFDCVIAVRGGDLYLTGTDRHGWGGKKMDSRSAYILGSVKAVTTFMEENLGSCFAYPGKLGVSTPKRERIELAEGFTRRVHPQLNYGAGRGQSMMYDYVNNNFGRGGYHVYGGHSYYDAVPVQKYGKSHPEYFALLGGKRNPSGNHLCISNPDVRRMVYANILRRLDAGASIAEVGQTDGYMPCECETCRQYGNTGDSGEKLWIFHRELAEKLAKDRPGKKALLIAYGPTKNPPKSFDKFPGNVEIELCAYSPEEFAAWRKIQGVTGFTVYIYNWGFYNMPGFTPKRTPEFCREQVKLFAANNVRGVYRCGFGENMGFEGPVYYVYGRLFENPDAPVEPMLDKFYKLAFQEAQGPMRAFYDMLYRRLAIYSTLQHAETLPGNPRILLAAVYSPDLLDSLGSNLARAEKLADGNVKVAKRLELVRAEFEYVKNLASIIHLYNAYRVHPDQAAFEALAGAIDARNAMIDRIYDAKGKIRPIAGWPEINLFSGYASRGQFFANGRLSATLGAPFTWNTKLLRDKKVLPGVGKKSFSIMRARGAVGMDFAQGFWTSVPWQELGGIQLGDPKSKTRFKAVYDDRNVYFAIESDLAAANTYSACGQDGPCWGQDSLELVVDPKGSREIYYHFIWNPVANSRYDAAFGLITDVLDPRYNQTDPAWNGRWDYVSRRIGGKWYSLVTIPFRTLGTQCPVKGARWTLNVGREDFGGKARTQPELSLWSPNLEAMSFHDRESFGEAVFE